MAKKQAVAADKPPAAPKSELAEAKKWLGQNRKPTVVFVARLSHDRCAMRAVWFGTAFAAVHGIAVSSRVAGQLPGSIIGGLHELCATTARSGRANDAAIRGDLSQSTAEGVWTSQYLSDCPLLFVTDDAEVKYDNVVFVADKKELAELLSGLRTHVSATEAAPTKTKVPPPPVKKPTVKPTPDLDAEPELEDVDTLPEDEADAGEGESEAYTAEELKALSDKELLALLTNAGIEVTKGAKRATLLELALSQTDE